VARPKHKRRRPSTAPLYLLAPIVVVGALIYIFSAGTPTKPPATTSTSVKSTVASTTTTSSSTTVPAAPSNQAQLDQALASLVHQRSGSVEIAVDNLATGSAWSFGPSTPQDEASVVKVNILAALLASGRGPTNTLTAHQRQLATQMIEESDNDAATDLWNAAGANVGIGAFDKKIGLGDTTPSPCVVCQGFPWPGWGLTTTTPRDQVALLRALFISRSYLNQVDRAYELHLMQSIVPDERWGVSSGVPTNVSVALKNGWLPLNSTDTDWQINSIGWVRGDARDYLVALLSTGNPSEQYGIQTLDSISALIWHFSKA
jgi:beta-lactamase class A